MIKLNTNENPYPPAPGVAEVLRHPDEDALRRYPDPAASVLVNALAESYHVKPEQVCLWELALMMCWLWHS